MNSADNGEEAHKRRFWEAPKNGNMGFDQSNRSRTGCCFCFSFLSDSYSRLLFWFMFLIASLFCPRNAFGQDSTAFNRVYDKIYKEISKKDLDKALAAGDSLYRVSSKPVFRIRSLILIAGIYQQKEELEKSIKYAEKAELLAREAADFAWQARANGLLGGQYRMMGLYSKAKGYTEKALKLVAFIKDAEQANSTRGLLLQELAFGSKEDAHYRQAIAYLEEAGISFSKLKDNRDFIVLNNERLLGDNYRLLESYDTALIHYHRALALSGGSPNHHTTGFLYRGIAEALLEKGDLNEAKKYVDKAEQFANESKYLQLKESVYATVKKYHEKVKDREQMAIAREKKDSVTGELLDKRAELLDKTYTQLEQRGIKAESVSSRKTVIIIVILLLLFAGIVFFLVYRKKKRQELLSFETILEQLHKKEKEPAIKHETATPVMVSADPEAPAPVMVEDEKPDAKGEEKRMMTVDTELKLLKGLAEFETSDLFLDGGLSLSSLATRLSTNTKYLSYLIKQHKKTDFNGYINELRVNYIIDKLKNHPDWRSYKISSLAAAAGFSSHSQFAAIFKSFTGLSPSLFIRYLDKKRET